ncbi:MAG: alanine:cation symporter family protein, partial [Candidatus Competibacteraceae bacterium]|nr:alanine:cation symporter family protein [Candidatus Competibacteraceae bacterium]
WFLWASRSASRRHIRVLFLQIPMMGILAIVNLLAITMLFPVGLRVLNDFRAQLKQGKEHPVFDPAKFPDLDIDLTAWNNKG